MQQQNQGSSGLGSAAIVGILAFGVFIVLGGLLLTGFVPSLFPPQASAESKNVDELFRVLLLIGGAIFFLVQGLLVFSIWQFRQKPGDDTDGPPLHGNATLEIVWTIIPAIIVVFLSIMSFNVWQANTTPKENENIIAGESIPIHVTGARYAWTITYDTGQLNVEGNPIVVNTGPVLHTYVGQNVHLTMTTDDVLHSFWVPAFRLKQDLLPGPNAVFETDGEGNQILDEEGNPILISPAGRPTDFRFTVIEVEDTEYPVEYPIVCAELCGDGHGRMRGTVVVHEDEEAFLNSFYLAAVDELREPPKDPVLRGHATIGNYACQGCHVLNQENTWEGLADLPRIDWSGLTGPPLNGIGVRAGTRVSGQSAEQYLVESIFNSQAYKVPGYQSVVMPVFGPDEAGNNQMSPEELYSIVAFLCTQTGTGNVNDSACDIENLTTTIPAAINETFGYEVDITFGGSDAPSVETTAEPDAETTDEPTDTDAEMTETPSPDSEATEEATE